MKPDQRINYQTSLPLFDRPSEQLGCLVDAGGHPCGKAAVPRYVEDYGFHVCEGCLGRILDIVEKQLGQRRVRFTKPMKKHKNNRLEMAFGYPPMYRRPINAFEYVLLETP